MHEFELEHINNFLMNCLFISHSTYVKKYKGVCGVTKKNNGKNSSRDEKIMGSILNDFEVKYKYQLEFIMEICDKRPWIFDEIKKIKY